MGYFFQEQKKQRKHNTIPFLVFSALLHIILIFCVVKFFREEAKNKIDPQNNVVFLDLAKQKLQRQFVESEDAPNQDIPKEARFEGKKNQTVAEETRAREVAPFQERRQKAQHSEVFKKLIPDGMKQASVTPNQVKAEEQSTPSATMDELKNVKEGAQTLLNTKEFIYYGFYHRLYRQLASVWYGKVRALYWQQVQRPTGIHLRRDYVTHLVVDLDKDGVVRAVHIVEASGIRELDKMAIDAFNEAGPYHNPPKGLIEADGFARISVGFVLHEQG